MTATRQNATHQNDNPISSKTSTVSPVFAGRETELTVLANTYETVRRGGSVTALLGGEAGVGKTRLVNEFVTRVHEMSPGGLVLVGDCLDPSAGCVPYAPITAALRRLVETIGAAEFAAIAHEEATGDLARLLPGGDDTAAEDPHADRTRLFEQLLTLLRRLAEPAPVVLVIEDAQWADRSTRDLLGFLARRLGRAPVLLLITYRSDELHRTHPLRSLLAALDRIDGVVKAEVPRLTRSEVAAQLGGVLGGSVEETLAARVYERTSGIPLLVETMATGAGPARVTAGRLSGTALRDLLLGGVQRLPNATQDVLRLASTAGGHVPGPLLAAVTGLDDKRLSAAVRPALDGNVLLADGDGYTFRHALIREAVHADLLPGEHSEAHRRFARALDRTASRGDNPCPGLAAALARHWYSGHDNERALYAAWRAAAESAHALAYAEQLEMLELVLALWDRVPNAAELVGGDHVAVLERAVGAAAGCGEPSRGLAFVRAGLAELADQPDAERMALLMIEQSRLRGQRQAAGPRT
ncbi:MAG TPA: AAA family ATPase [Streptosporangiaceae bacterium]|jgi:predicted ATPase